MAAPIPDQIFFKLSELSELLGVESHVLRFWEKEFQIRPLQTGPRKKLYRRKDLESFQSIKRLLYEDRFTIAGAKKRLESPNPDQGELFGEDRLGSAGAMANPANEAAQLRKLLDKTRRELLAIKDMLTNNKLNKTARAAADKVKKS